MAKLLKHIHTRPLLGFILTAAFLLLLIDAAEARPFQVLTQDTPPSGDSEVRALVLEEITLTDTQRTSIEFEQSHAAESDWIGPIRCARGEHSDFIFPVTRHTYSGLPSFVEVKDIEQPEQKEGFSPK